MSGPDVSNAAEEAADAAYAALARVTTEQFGIECFQVPDDATEALCDALNAYYAVVARLAAPSDETAAQNAQDAVNAADIAGATVRYQALLTELRALWATGVEREPLQAALRAAGWVEFYPAGFIRETGKGCSAIITQDDGSDLTDRSTPWEVGHYDDLAGDSLDYQLIGE
jgi:hypothetical protein